MHMSIKYKIEDAKKRKRTNFQLLRQWIHLSLNNEINKLSRIKSKGGNGDGGRKPGSTNKITLAKLAEQMADLIKTVKDGFAEQAKFNKSIREDLNRIVKLNNLKH